jgi:hypothetical protein
MISKHYRFPLIDSDDNQLENTLFLMTLALSRSLFFLSLCVFVAFFQPPGDFHRCTSCCCVLFVWLCVAMRVSFFVSLFSLCFFVRCAAVCTLSRRGSDDDWISFDFSEFTHVDHIPAILLRTPKNVVVLTLQPRAHRSFHLKSIQECRLNTGVCQRPNRLTLRGLTCARSLGCFSGLMMTSLIQLSHHAQIIETMRFAAFQRRGPSARINHKENNTNLKAKKEKCLFGCFFFLRL